MGVKGDKDIMRLCCHLVGSRSLIIKHNMRQATYLMSIHFEKQQCSDFILRYNLKYRA